MTTAQLTNNTTARALTQQLVDRVVQATGKQVKYPASFELSIVSVDDSTMQELNEQHRGVNQVTDVLSFPYSVDTEAGTGEIVICYPQAQRQAESKQIAVGDELQWLLIHGILHVLGYDHETAEDAKVMRPLERTILAELANA